MSLNIFFRHQAQIEYATATTWYEDARSGLGDEFEAAVEVVLRTAAINPARYAIADGDVHEAPVEGFPYCVYYRIRASRLIVIAVYHQSRDPRGWRRRS